MYNLYASCRKYPKIGGEAGEFQKPGEKSEVLQGKTGLEDIERGDKIPKLETFVHIVNTLSASADDVLQDSLGVGYLPKSNYIIRKLDGLDPVRKKQALDILDSVISSLKEN